LHLVSLPELKFLRFSIKLINQNKKKNYLKKLSEKRTSTSKENPVAIQELSFKQFQEFIFVSTERQKEDFGKEIRDEILEVYSIINITIKFHFL
jgi:hypothetical protein